MGQLPTWIVRMGHGYCPIMSLANETRWMDAVDQARLVADGSVTPLELVDAAIERVEDLDGPLNAVVVRWWEHARQLARDGEIGGGPFRGVPYLIKDLAAHYKGQPMTNGNVALKAAGYVSDFDSNVVARYRDAGMIPIGRTSSPEMGSVPITEPLAHGPCRNPWNLDYSPGGSSGGAASAVAAGMVPVAHASDGGGSIRLPAAHCGLVGLKTSQGRISQGPDRTESYLAVDFAVSRTVRDSAILLDQLAVPGVGDSIIAPPPSRPFAMEVGADPGSLRIGLLDAHPNGNPIHSDCLEAVTKAAAQLEALGHRVEHAFPSSLADESFADRFMALWYVSRRSNVDIYERMAGRPLEEHEIEPLNRLMAARGEQFTGMEYAGALAAVAKFRRDTLQWWADGWDLLLSPTMAERPFHVGAMESEGADLVGPVGEALAAVPFTPPFNTTGQPAINLPLHWSDDGLPIGVQLAADYGREDVLIQVASQLETAHPWAHRTPPEG